MKRRDLILGLGVLGGVCLGVEDAAAALAHAVTLRELSIRSQRIIVAEAVEAFSQWERTGQRRRIVTYTRLLVRDSFLPVAPPSEVMLQTLGGRVGKIGQVVPGEATPQLGEHALFFLTPETEGVHHVTAMAQGHYPVLRDEAGERLIPSRRLGKLLMRGDAAVTSLRDQSLERARQLVSRALAP